MIYIYDVYKINFSTGNAVLHCERKGVERIRNS